jgi:hypothetical protein
MCVIDQAPEVLTAVNALLDAGTNAAEVSRRLQLPRATVYRHWNKCYVRTKLKVKEQEALLRRPNGGGVDGTYKFHVRWNEDFDSSNIPAKDWIVLVRYGKAPSPMLTHDQAAVLKQQMENSTTAQNAAPDTEVRVDHNLPADETETSLLEYFTRRELAEQKPQEAKPEPAAQGMADLLSTVAASLRGSRRCG